MSHVVKRRLARSVAIIAWVSAFVLVAAWIKSYDQCFGYSYPLQKTSWLSPPPCLRVCIDEGQNYAGNGGMCYKPEFYSVKLWSHLPRKSYPRFYSGAREWSLLLPSWIPVVMLAALGTWLWSRHRGFPIGRCQRCGYDLTGNESGICPECGLTHSDRHGTRTTAQTRSAAPDR